MVAEVPRQPSRGLIRDGWRLGMPALGRRPGQCPWPWMQWVPEPPSAHCASRLRPPACGCPSYRSAGIAR